MSDRPLMLIEILVAEYEQQARMNNWLALPPPYTHDAITRVCDRLDKEARKIIPADAQSQESSPAGEDLEKELTPEQQEFICNQTDRLLEGFYQHLHERAKKGQPRTAICFSGGGIRSATFGLGLLQGLVGSGVGLDKFHYVSTVSGGGYIGSWLSAWIHRQGVRSAQDGLLPLSERIKKASDPDNTEVPILPNDPDPIAIQHLRRYSNYMSPKLGLFSADTWTLVAIFLRNLLLNWTVLIPLLLGALTIPRLAVSIASWNRAGQHPWVEKVAILAAFLAGMTCIAYMVAGLPSWRDRSRLSERLKSETWFLWFCWLMLNLSALLSAAYWAWNHIRVERKDAPAWWQFFHGYLWQPMVLWLEKIFGWCGLSGKWIPFALFGLLFHIVGYVMARVFLIKRGKGVLDTLMDFGTRALTGVAGGICLWAATLLFQTPVTITSIANPNCDAPVTVESQKPIVFPSPSPSPIGSVVMQLPSLPARLEVSVVPQPTPVDTAAKQKQQQDEEAKRVSKEAGLYVTFGPPLFLVMFLLASTLFIGFASTYTNDADREWLSRTGGWMLISIFGWSALCGLVIFGPVGLAWLWQHFTTSLVSVGAGSGLLTLLGGFSSKTSANKKTQDGKKGIGIISQLLSTSLPLAATVFILLVLASLSLATSWLIAAFCRSLQTSFSPGGQGIWWHLVVLYESTAGRVAWLIVPALLIGLLMGLFININKFSLHSAYRDRLIRAYLGASNVTRQPNPFTGFDDRDNVQMHDLLTELFRPANITDPIGLANKLQSDQTECKFIYSQLSQQTRKMVEDCAASRPISSIELKQALADDLNRIIQSDDLWVKPGFAETSEMDGTKTLKDKQPSVPIFPYTWLPKSLNERPVYVQRVLINRKLIEATFVGFVTSPEEFETEARPLHVVNITLNLVGGKELAWQERKAQSFTVSPLHAGSYGLGFRDVKKYAVSRQQNGALSLGTSLAISGAAVSPNMGYNSSPPVTFLLSLFNVRLGWWLGNPGEAGRDTYTKPSPFFAPRPLIAETLGMTDSQHPYVYLSDGAHFENLALYEMVRRRCHYIILSDVGADPDFNFDDLGNALRKIRIDMGVPIELWEMPIQHRAEADKLFAADGKSAGKYCALARIKYSEVDGENAEDGLLLYIKPTVYGVEPSDVQNYAKANATFPHETTGDQMYSESQFESYRTLAQYAVETITEKLDKRDADKNLKAITMPMLFSHVKKTYLGIHDTEKPAMRRETEIGGWEGDVA
ncbi:MAG: hypothetical protein ABI977_24755 [Acidobacteriota bacterium]